MTTEDLTIPNDLGTAQTQQNGNGTISLEEAIAFTKRKLDNPQDPFSLATLEERTGRSRGGWSNFFNEKYEVGSTSYENHANALINFVEEWRTTESLIQTQSVRKITKTIDLVRATNQMAVITGEAGTSKTETAKYYAQTHENTALVVANRAMSPNHLFTEIMLAIGKNSSGAGTPYDKMKAIRDHLRHKEFLVIVDEADQLTVRVLEMIRFTWDDGHMGLVLLGLPRLIEMMKTGADRKDNLAQLYSRASFKVHLDPPSEKEVRTILERKGYQFDDTIMHKLLHEISGHGELRRLDRILDNAERLSVKNKRPVDGVIINAAIKLLIEGPRA